MRTKTEEEIKLGEELSRCMLSHYKVNPGTVQERGQALFLPL